MNKKFIASAIAVGALLLLSLPGCTIQRMNEVKKSAEDTGVKASSLIQQMGDNHPVVRFTNSQYINTSPLPKPKYDAPRQVVNCNIQYLTVKPQDIFELSQDLSEQCHIRFRVSPDASAYL
ncbi:PilN family type IVB pilus formation outer membrane protein, partial [Salmonella enterica]|nr:PilN family type IVB pilus formation outer membrane protein [Salmonella enterica]